MDGSLESCTDLGCSIYRCPKATKDLYLYSYIDSYEEEIRRTIRAGFERLKS